MNEFYISLGNTFLSCLAAIFCAVIMTKLSRIFFGVSFEREIKNGNKPVAIFAGSLFILIGLIFALAKH